MICQLGLQSVILKNVWTSTNGIHTLTHTDTHCTLGNSQSSLCGLSCLPCALSAAEETDWKGKRRSARGAISCTFAETTGRSIANERPHTSASTSHISCLAPARSTSKGGDVGGGVVSVCVNFHMPEPRKSPNESPCCLQHHHPKEEVTEAGNKDSPCRVVVLHLSLLIHCCIDCVFIWRGSGGELMSEAAILASTSLPLLFLIWQAAEALGGCRVSRLLLWYKRQRKDTNLEKGHDNVEKKKSLTRDGQ